MKENNQKPLEEWKIDETLIRANIVQIDTIGKMNKMYFKELQGLAEKIEQKTKEILRINFSDEEIEKFFKGSEIKYKFKIANYKEQKENIEFWKENLKRVNHQFVADNFFLMFSFFIVGIQDKTQEEKEANFNSVFWAEGLMNEKEELFHQYNNVEEKITENNREIGELRREILQKVRRKESIEVNGEKENIDVLDITNTKQESQFIELLEHSAKSSIDEVELFKLMDKTRLQLKVNIETKQEKDNFFLSLSIKGEPNYFSEYFEIKEKKAEEKDFKDIKLKTQAISMYKPTQIIFLEGEEISKIYKEQAIVTIPFGLKIENEKEVTYQITKLNYEQSDKDLRFFNACISAQWNLVKNNYPINTFIEETTLYQIYIGDTTFTYRPKKSELQKMKNSIMGMNSNQARMQFESSYNHLSEDEKIKYIDEGTILPVRYKTIEIERKNGQKYSKSGYVFESIIPLFSFMSELKLINTAPLQIESVLKSSQMNDEITRILKEEIAQLYYFKSRNKKNDTQNGFKRKVFITENGTELTPKEWNEKNVESKKEGQKLRGYWKYYTRRTIDSMIKDCKFTMTNGEILNAYDEKTIDRKTYSRFIDSVITFLRYSKDIQYGQDKYIKDFILYDKQGKIIKESEYITENERQKLKRKKVKRNPSVDKIDIIIT